MAPADWRSVVVEHAERLEPQSVDELATILGVMSDKGITDAGGAYMSALCLRLRLNEANEEIARLKAEVVLLSGDEPPAVDLGGSG